jgi:hypothetical protein
VPADKADAFFFVGRGEPIDDPESVIELDCDDSYWGLPEKVRAIARWALEHGYGYMLKCDDDVLVSPENLLASGYDRQPYTGRMNRVPDTQRPFGVPMGFCYWLSRQCMALIKDVPTPTKHNDDELWVAGILHENGIYLTDDRRYRLCTGEPINALHKRPIRPLKKSVEYRLDSVYGTFAWCVALESGMYPKLPDEVKVRYFMELFNTFSTQDKR